MDLVDDLGFGIGLVEFDWCVLCGVVCLCFDFGQGGVVIDFWFVFVKVVQVWVVQDMDGYDRFFWLVGIIGKVW